MSLLHGLHAMLTTGYAQFEGSLVVGGDELAAGVVHQCAVDLERHSRHGNARVAVVDIA